MESGAFVGIIAMMIPIVAIVMHYWYRAKKMEHDRLQMQQQLSIVNPHAAANQAATTEALKQVEALQRQLTDTTATLSKVNSRLQNLESIVTSPGFLATQVQTADFQRLTDEEQAAELAKHIAAREGRITT
jgi:septal ring factor EnvC (AmiA/AmiB activator)